MSTTPGSSNEDRLQFLFMNLVGQLVSVHAVDGSVTEGLFVSRTDDDAVEPSILLSKTRNRRSVVSNADALTEVNELLLIPLSSVVFVNAVGLRVEAAAAGRVGHFRSTALEMNWADLPPEDDRAGVNGVGLEEEEKTWQSGKWDQFEANKKFGVRSTYNENLYTTTLDRSKFSKEQVEAADRMSREIERSSARGGIQHRIERGEEVEEDEGALYSDVQRGREGKPHDNSHSSGSRKAPPSAPCAVDVHHHQALTTHLHQNVVRELPQGSSATGSRVGATSSSSAPAPPLPSLPSEATRIWSSIAAAVDARGVEACRCPADWPGDGDFYDVEDSDYKRAADEQHHHGHGHHGAPLHQHQQHQHNSNRGYGGGGGGLMYPQPHHHHSTPPTYQPTSNDGSLHHNHLHHHHHHAANNQQGMHQQQHHSSSNTSRRSGSGNNQHHPHHQQQLAHHQQQQQQQHNQHHSGAAVAAYQPSNPMTSYPGAPGGPPSMPLHHHHLHHHHHLSLHHPPAAHDGGYDNSMMGGRSGPSSLSHSGNQQHTFSMYPTPSQSSSSRAPPQFGGRPSGGGGGGGRYAGGSGGMNHAQHHHQQQQQLTSSSAAAPPKSLQPQQPVPAGGHPGGAPPPGGFAEPHSSGARRARGGRQDHMDGS